MARVLLWGEMTYGSSKTQLMATDTVKTEVGSYFISNYPPFSQWTAEGLAEVRAAMNAPPLARLG